VTSTASYAGMPVLVTGARGFIGSWLVRRLRDAGATVIDAPDVLEGEQLTRALADNGVRAVFHLAAKSKIDAATADPLGTFDVNVRGTYTLFDACRASGAPLERVVVASTHGAPAGGDPYRASKACVELIARSYAASFGLPVAVLRLANVYGGGDLSYTRLVPGTARALALGQPPVLRSDGTRQVDFLYVEDAVDAYLAVAASVDPDDDGSRGRVWAGAGEPVAVLDMVRRLIAVSGRAVDPQLDGSAEHPRPAADDRRDGDASALHELGWRPHWGLDQGLAETYRWYERQLA
jgi:CDP-glucose 4,6-dehydratase